AHYVLLAAGHVLLPFGQLQLGCPDPFAPLVDLDEARAHLRLHALELDELTTPSLDASLGVLDQTLSPPETFCRFRERLLALAEVGLLCGKVRGALADLFPERRYAGTPLLELGRALADRLLAAPLSLGEGLPGSLQFPLVVGHLLQFCVRPRLPFPRGGVPERSNGAVFGMGGGRVAPRRPPLPPPPPPGGAGGGGAGAPAASVG